MIMLLSLPTFTGCGLIAQLGSIEDVIDKAIGEIGLQSSNWQEILGDLEDELLNRGFNDASANVSNILSSTVAIARQDTQCYTDSIKRGIIEDLKLLKAQITGDTYTASTLSLSCFTYPY